jgi:predicted Zn-dependent protease
VKSEALDKAVDAILGRLVQAQAQMPAGARFGYRCEVLDAPQINAVMLPGGRIVVFRGLLDVTGQPEELAAVLAHEISHGEKRHISKRLARQFGLLVLGKAGGGDAVVIGELAKHLVSLAFDRSQEEEADRFAQALLQKSGIDPRALATALRHMKEAPRSSPAPCRC